MAIPDSSPSSCFLFCFVFLTHERRVFQEVGTRAMVGTRLLRRTELKFVHVSSVAMFIILFNHIHFERERERALISLHQTFPFIPGGAEGFSGQSWWSWSAVHLFITPSLSLFQFEGKGGRLMVHDRFVFPVGAPPLPPPYKLQG